jgi:hypothetical protein
MMCFISIVTPFFIAPLTCHIFIITPFLFGLPDVLDMYLLLDHFLLGLPDALHIYCFADFYWVCLTCSMSIVRSSLMSV